MDHALWITWYDLPEDGRSDYLLWLHETYIPAILGRPGILYGAHYAEVVRKSFVRPMHGSDDRSIPSGHQFILMFAAEHAHVFGDPVSGDHNAALPASSRKMLALRIGERSNVMAEAARVAGKALPHYESGMLMAPCIQIGSFNFPWQQEEELLKWFAQWRMPTVAALPGCVRIRKLASVSGWAKHGVIYEYESVAARNRDYPMHEDAYPEMKAWSDKVVEQIIHPPPGTGALATRIWPPVSQPTP